MFKINTHCRSTQEFSFSIWDAKSSAKVDNNFSFKISFIENAKNLIIFIISSGTLEHKTTNESKLSVLSAKINNLKGRLKYVYRRGSNLVYKNKVFSYLCNKANRLLSVKLIWISRLYLLFRIAKHIVFYCFKYSDFKLVYTFNKGSEITSEEFGSKMDEITRVVKIFSEYFGFIFKRNTKAILLAIKSLELKIHSIIIHLFNGSIDGEFFCLTINYKFVWVEMAFCNRFENNQLALQMSKFLINSESLKK
jgi:hypothetical protein